MTPKFISYENNLTNLLNKWCVNDRLHWYPFEIFLATLLQTTVISPWSGSRWIRYSLLVIGSDRSRQGQGQIHQLLITSIAWAGGPHRPWRLWWRGSWICDIGKFCPTASYFCYDFLTENGLQRSTDLGPKIITKNGCCRAIFSHWHDLGALDMLGLSKKQPKILICL